MRWFAVHHGLAQNGKWMETGPLERGAWITLVTISAANDPRGWVGDRRTAIGLLTRDRFPESERLVDTLIEVGLIDEIEDQLWMHDFVVWQLAIRKPSDQPEAIRDRVAKHRAERKKEPKKENGKGEERRGEVTPSNAS
jgi:hypothetical protein